MATTQERTPQHATAAGIDLRGIEKAYPSPTGRVQAVRGIDVTVAAGETVALLGPNGAGKSTTIDILLGLQSPDRGTVTLFGQTPREAIGQGRVGAMLQSGGLLRELTVHELVTMMASLYPAPLDAADALSLARADGLAERRTDKLSGGETQRVRFAIALVSNPDLLVLDEPTVGMDVETRHAFWGTVREYASRGRTIVFATHYLDEADAFADRALLMANGKIVADGPTTVIKAMVGSHTIRATLPDARLEALARLPGVTSADRRGEAVELICADSDAAIRALLAEYADARDIEIRVAGLEEAFLQLTSDDAEHEQGS